MTGREELQSELSGAGRGRNTASMLLRMDAGNTDISLGVFLQFIVI